MRDKPKLPMSKSDQDEIQAIIFTTITERLSQSLVNLWRTRGRSIRDLEQEGFLIAIGCVRTFEDGPRAKFSSYLVAALRRTLSEYITCNVGQAYTLPRGTPARSLMKGRHPIITRHVAKSFRAERKGILDHLKTATWEPVQTMVNKEEMAITLERVAKLPRRFRRWFGWRYLKHMPLVDAASKAGLTRHQARLEDMKLLELIQKGRPDANQ